MSDMFSHNVPEDDILKTLDAMHSAPHHSYLSLTKAAPQLRFYTDRMPPNLWVGVSSPPDWMRNRRLNRSQQEAMLRNSMKVLAEVKDRTGGNIVWMSAEPVSWDLASVIGNDHPFDWIVIGAASDGRKDYQPDPTHIENLLRIMDASSTPVFYKGNIGALFDLHDFGSENLNRWREDFPTHYRDGSEIPAIVERQNKCQEYGWPRISLPLA
jgi:protein gp37